MGNKKKRQELIERWDTFLEKIKQRCKEMINQANQGTDMFVPQLQFDTNAVGNAWTGIKSQIYQLTEKMEEGWNKMDDLFDEAESSAEQTEEQRDKKQETKTYINWQYEKNKTLAIGKSAKQVLFNVKNHINENKIHSCTQCGSPLNINIYTFMAKNIKCDSCGSVNTYEPDGKIIALESWVVEPLAKEHVLEEQEKEFHLEELISYTNFGQVTKDQKSKLINLRKARINKYYQFLISSIPEKTEYYTRKRDERIKWSEIVRT